MDNIKVSVSLITYNHEDYITECIHSALNQKTSFNYEVVVANDCSTDRTGIILDELARKNPERLRVIHRQKNLGIVRNAVATILECRGEYVSLLEGDDLWIDDTKLQSQADFLDSNPDCALCFTNQLTFWKDDFDSGKKLFADNSKPPEKFDLKYFFDKNVNIPNNSKMFRRQALPNPVPEWIYESFQWDWALHIIQGKFGNYGYLDKVSLGYRRHPEATVIASNNVKLAKSGISTLKGLNKYLSYQYNHIFGHLSWHYNTLAFAYLTQGDFFRFVVYYFAYLLNLKSLKELYLRDDAWKIKEHFFRKWT